MSRGSAEHCGEELVSGVVGYGVSGGEGDVAGGGVAGGGGSGELLVGDAVGGVDDGVGGADGAVGVLGEVGVDHVLVADV